MHGPRSLHDCISRVVTLPALSHVRGGTWLVFRTSETAVVRGILWTKKKTLRSTRDKVFAKSFICFPGRRETESEFVWDAYFVYKLATLPGRRMMDKFSNVYLVEIARRASPCTMEIGISRPTSLNFQWYLGVNSCNCYDIRILFFSMWYSIF